jgi:proline dehydrogenase
MDFLRTAFIGLSESQELRHLAESSALARKVSRRFVAGMTLDEALDVCGNMNRQGISVTLDALGENVSDAEHAQASGAIYHSMLDHIAERQLDANVSLKLTQVGMDLPGDVAESIVLKLGQHAKRLKNFVRVDMEGSSYTQATIDMVQRLHADQNVASSIGIVVQAYLFRTEKDVESLLASNIRIRLCKGAYSEAANLAFPAKLDVDNNYVHLMKILMKSGVFHGLATHDESIIDQAKRFCVQEKIDRSTFEFQMLYGIRRELQRSLIKDGYRVRVYVPFGGEWYPYFMRRLAERPANALFLAKNIFK